MSQPHQYEDFTVTLTGTPGSYKLSVRGERGLVILDELCDVTALTHPALVATLDTVRAGYAPGAAEMIAVGSALYTTLFPSSIATLWDKAQAYAEQEKRQVRLRLEVVADTLEGLPWELLYEPQAQLFLMPRSRFSLVRGVARAGVAVRPLRTEGQANILRLVANPVDRVALEAEQNDWLTPAWQERGTITIIHAATLPALQQALITLTPHILHFDGHGGWDEATQEGYIVLEDGQGGSVEIKGSELFTLLDGTSVRLVVLAACKSGQGGGVKQFAGVAQRVISSGALPAVVAMQYDIPDSVAVLFAETFYRTLAAGQPLDAAVTEGRKAVLLQRGEGDAAWGTPVLYLRTASGDLFTSVQRTVPFQAEALPATDIPRHHLITQLRDTLVNPVTKQGQPLTIGVHGAGGYGKTSLVRAICHDPAVRAAFPDGVLWVHIGQNSRMDERTRELALVDKVLNWVTALGGERTSLTDLPSAMDRLNQTLGQRQCLLVIDNVWNQQDAKPFLQGIRCAKIITARNSTAFPNDAVRLPIAGMSDTEARSLLVHGIPIVAPAEAVRVAQLAQRLGEYPLLLSLVNRTLVDRVVGEQSPFTDALVYVEDALTQFGVTAFDDEGQAVQAVLKISLEQLTPDELQRLTELALFPEDTAIPLSVAITLWKTTGNLAPVAADRLLSRLWQLSLLLTLDRRPEYKQLRLHDIVRAYLLEPLNTPTKQTIHAQIVGSLGAWQTWDKENGYAWRWYTYHLEAAGQTDTLYELVTNPTSPTFRDTQQRIVQDVRVALADIQRALGVAIREEQLYRATHLVRTYRDVYQTEQVSDDVFAALDQHRWELATQIAAYYGTPPRLQNVWVVMFYLLIAWEAALAGAWQAAEQTLHTALAFHRAPNYPVNRLVDLLWRRIALTLGQQLADGMDEQGWVLRLDAPSYDTLPPTVTDYEADGHLQRSAAVVAEYRTKLAAGESDPVSSLVFADEEVAAGESGMLGQELARVANRSEGQALIRETIEAVLLNRYPFYRDIALGAIGGAVMAIPEGQTAGVLLRTMITAGLNDEGITFEWELPSQLLMLAYRHHAPVPFHVQQLLNLSHHTQDKWGTFYRVRCADAGVTFYNGDMPGTTAILQELAHQSPDVFYAGYSVLHLLTLHNRHVEFRQPPLPALLSQAAIQTSYIQDQFTLAPARARLVQLAEQLNQHNPVPTVAEVEQFLQEEEDVDTQRYFAEYALSQWLAAAPPMIKNVKTLLPRLLEKHGTTLDLYLARWWAIRGATVTATEVEAALRLIERYLRTAPPSNEPG